MQEVGCRHILGAISTEAVHTTVAGEPGGHTEVIPVPSEVARRFCSTVPGRCSFPLTGFPHTHAASCVHWSAWPSHRSGGRVFSPLFDTRALLFVFCISPDETRPTLSDTEEQ